jgi:hypothetical protein
VARAARAGIFMLSMRVPPIRRASLRLTSGYNPAEQPFLRAPVQMTD